MIIRYITILFLFIGPLHTMAQGKKNLEKDLANCKATSDSLRKAFNSLTVTYDSIHKRYLEYDTMYSVVSEKYIGFKFKPAQISHIIDSMRAKRDSTLVKSGAETPSDTSTVDLAPLAGLAPDSVGIYKHFADSLREENNHYKYVFDQYFAQGTLPKDQKDLMGVWKVSLQWFELVKKDERTGLVMQAASTTLTYLATIHFVDGELAELTLNNGTKVKCFYKVNGFSSNTVYSIDFSKWKEVDNRLFVNPSSTGELNVSYQKGNGYFHGFMRKQ